MGRKRYEKPDWLEAVPPLPKRQWKLVNYPKNKSEECRATKIIQQRASEVQKAKSFFKTTKNA